MALRAIADYVAGVREFFPAIGDEEAERRVWTSLQLICDEENLPFLIAVATIVTEAAYSTGTLSIAGGVNLTLTSGVWDPTWTNRVMVIATSLERFVVTLTGAESGQLDHAWRDSTVTGLPYVMFRDTYAMPADCGFASEIGVVDIAQNFALNFMSYEVFDLEQVCDLQRRTGLPLRVARGPLSATGAPQLIFGPAPSTVRAYSVPYVRSIQKPATVDTPLTWPNSFHDALIYRAVMEHADRKGHPRRFEFRRRYEHRIARAVRKFGGDNELSHQLKTPGQGHGLNVLLNVVKVRA